MATLVVATFNVRHGLGRDGVLDFGRCADVVRELDPDLVALQELDRNLPRSGYVDQPQVLQDVTGLTVFFHPTLSKDGGEYGIAVAGRGLAAAEFLSLPLLEAEEPRGAIVSQLEHLAFVGTHLSRSARARRLQLLALAAAARGYERAVIAGDLNARPRELGPLAAAGFALPRSAPPTRGRARIDHITASRGIHVSRTWAVRTPASDHDLLAAELRL